MVVWNNENVCMRSMIFERGKFHVFITTDVAARGIDFPNITHVINYDFPTNKENYVHRIGRTASNGKRGKTISFLSNTEGKMKEAVEQYAQIDIPYCEAANVADAANKAKFISRQKEKVKLKEEKRSSISKIHYETYHWWR